MNPFSLTPILRRILLHRCDPRKWPETDTAAIQQQQFDMLLRKGSATAWGDAHGYRRGMEYEKFHDATPLCSYEDIRPIVNRMIAGEANLLWPGVTRRFAQSSGTTGGKSKFVPITDDSLRYCHYRGGTYSLTRYLTLNPESRIFAGKSFILGGSFANTLGINRPDVRIGDLSATLIDRINPLANLTRIPDKHTALLADWEEKLPALVEAGLKADVTNIAGVPSWFLTVLKKILERAGAESIHDVWPNLEVFFHGGIAFGPYRAEYDAITNPSLMHYIETYNASEGFFGVQADASPGRLMLLVDCGMFFEFLPLGADPAEAVPAWKVKQGEVYEMIITGCNGLWRYRIGDTVKIEATDPVRFTIAGRTKAFINAFGEELMVHNADRALERVCGMMNCSVTDYTAAPVYTHGRHRGRHQWVIEFSSPPESISDFAAALDSALRAENSDYDAKRTDDIFLAPLEVTVARRGLFDSWLESTGKRGGQRKVPRLCNNRDIIEKLLEMNR